MRYKARELEHPMILNSARLAVFTTLIFIASVHTAQGAEQCAKLFAGEAKFTSASTAQNPAQLIWQAVHEAGQTATFHLAQNFAIYFQPGKKLPVTQSRFARTRYAKAVPYQGIAKAGDKLLPGPIGFGYEHSDGFREIGFLEYVIIDAKGDVVEVGARTREMLAEFKRHIFGRVISPKETETIAEINNKIFAKLRELPATRAVLDQFVAKRTWPKAQDESGKEVAIENFARLAYYSREMFDVQQWGRENGYTAEQLRDAGWLNLRFNDAGFPRYIPVANDAIRIPFLDAQGNIVSWRSRLMNPRPGQGKYQSAPLDRSLDRELTLNETLYNGWKLDPAVRESQIRGKTVIITEGEFKCLISGIMTGHAVLGIPGISQFTPEMAIALRDAQPKEVVIVLDRDPRGKGMQRLDGITDSQRAAFEIARELERHGLKAVKVGNLPDVFEGGKVGIDDLILSKGVAPVKALLDTALPPSEYARAIGLNAELNEISVLLRRVQKALAKLDTVTQRSGKAADPAQVQFLKQAETSLRANYQSKFQAAYPGARNFNQPQYGLDALFPGNVTPGKDLLVTYASGESQAIQKIESPVLLLNYDSPQAMKHDFPADDYQVEYSVSFSSQGAAPTLVPALIRKKDESKKVVAMGWLSYGAAQFSGATRAIHAHFGR